MQAWTPPAFEEVCMNAEIGAYQSDLDSNAPAALESSQRAAPSEAEQQAAEAEFAA